MPVLRIIPRVFAAIGIVLLLVASWLYTGERRFVASAARAQGRVVSLEYSRDGDGGGAYYPLVRFTTADGRDATVRSRVGSSPPSHRVGDSVEVLYDPAAPERGQLAGFFSLYLGTFVTGLLAAVFGGTGAVWLAMRRRAAALAEELRRLGRRIEARVTGVELRTNIAVNNRHPWRIVAEWSDQPGGEPRRFYSANLWTDPTPHVGETVGVFVDPYAPKRYVMDLDFLPGARE